MPRTRWPASRVASAAFLAGRGYDFAMIAADDTVQSTHFATYNALYRVGVVARVCEKTDALVAVQANTVADLGRLARARGESSEKLIRHLLHILAADEALARNVLDDDDERSPSQPSDG